MCFRLNDATDAENMAIRMAYVEFADAPGHIGGRHHDFDILLDCEVVSGVNVVHPNGHPATSVSRLTALLAESLCVAARSAPALTVQAKKYLCVATSNSSKSRWLAPVP